MRIITRGHLSAEELVDLLDGALSKGRAGHVSSCEACHDRLSELRRLAGIVTQASVPEPSPLFWDRFSARVSESVRAEPSHSPRWLDGFWVRRLVPFAATAVVVVGLVAGLLPRGTVRPREPGGATSASGGSGAPARDVNASLAADDDGPWSLVAELSASVGADQVENTSLDPELGSADEAAKQLSGQERLELVRLLKVELKESSSLSPEP
jgi:hypothetical protein